MLGHVGRVAPKTLAELCPKATPEALDLRQKLMPFNPTKRFTAEQALEHPFVAAFHNKDDEPSAPAPITISLPDDTRYTVAEYRNKLYAEIIAKKRVEKKEREPTLLPRAARAAEGAAGTRTATSAAGHRATSSAYGTRTTAATRAPGASATGAAARPPSSSTATRTGVTRPASTASATRVGASATRPAVTSSAYGVRRPTAAGTTATGTTGTTGTTSTGYGTRPASGVAARPAARRV